MDISVQFRTTCESMGNTRGCRLAASPFVLRASDVLRSLESFETLVSSIYEDYVDMNGCIGIKSKFSSLERQQFDQESTLFSAACASQINQLRCRILNENPQRSQHDLEIVSYLGNRLNRFSKAIQLMRKDRERIAINPFRIHSNSYKILSVPLHSSNDLVSDKFAVESNDKYIKQQNQIKQNQQALIERYSAEVAPASKMDQYKAIAVKHKEMLLEESKSLSVQFGHDCREAITMESNVEQIADMLTEFAEILHSQSEHVEIMHEASQEAVVLVQQSDTELQLTLDRTSSSQRNWILVTLGLAFLLIILDWITP